MKTPTRYFLKRMSMGNDWLMHASNDRRCRSVTLWQYGLLDQVSPHVDHTIVACSHDGDGWAILMRDVSGGIVLSRLNHAQIFRLLDALAAIHATFWNSPVLNDPGLGLCNTTEVISTLSVPTASIVSDVPGALPGWILEGWTILEDSLEPVVMDALHALMANPTPLYDALSRYPTTLIHGDYRSGQSGNVSLMPGALQPAVFDWQLAGCALMTIDLGWFVNAKEVMLTISAEKASTYYRDCLETRLGQRFETTYWQAMLDLGFLANVLRKACFTAYWGKHEPDETNRALNQSVVKHYNQQVRAGVKWL
jgi:hypothetical protein